MQNDRSVHLMLAFCLGLASAALIHTHQEKSFVAFMRENGLAYTGDQYQFRLGLYLANTRYVQEHNAADKGFLVELNKFAVYTPAEYKTLLGARQAPIDAPVLKLSGRAAPDAYDWRTQGGVGPIKDQGQCGSCWAFSAIGAQESQYYITNKVLQSLSEQNLVDCVTSCYGCDGGWPSQAYTYVVQRQSGKFNLESAYPYTARDGTCRYSSSGAVSLVTGYSSVTKGSESALLDATYNNGPVSVAIDASHNSFQLYKSGVYNEASCSTSNLDHAVVVVGYGNSGSTPYWIVRNSWGTSWGIQGYIWMSRNKNNQCGIATTAVVPKDK
jgi:cathepsin L